MKHYLGMDIGGTKCAVVICEEGSEKIKDKIKFDTLSSRDPYEIIGNLIENAQKILSRNSITDKDIISCGISCGGPLNQNTGVIMSPPNLPNWDNIPICKIVKEKLDIPCVLRNDADACALAEWKFGAGKGCNNMIFLTFGTGMGAGLILNGKLYSGATGTAGEVGHIRLADFGPLGYGKEGSFEGFCSGGGIANLGKIMLKDYKSETLLKNTELTAKSVAEAANNGDALALEIYKKCGEMLGKGLAIIVDILNPERIVIGSIFERSGNLLINSMTETLIKEALDINYKACKIVPASLGDEIGDFAAIGVAKEYEGS